VDYVTVETWQMMKDKGLARRFKVIDDKDLQDTVVATPQAFTEPVSFEIPEMERDEIKAELDKIEGFEYNKRASTDKLYQLYLENL